MTDNFDTEAFIEAIYERPSLWDVRSDNYANKTIKKKCWNEIFCTFVKGFEDLPQDVKEKKSVDLQRRWKSLRNSYSRELAKQKSSKSGGGASNRKQYVYFDMLSFLMPTTITSVTTIPKLNGEEEETRTVETEENVCEEQITPKRSRKREADPHDVLSELNETLKQSIKYRTDSDNDDKLFLISLHSHLKTIPVDQKLFAKTEILQVLAKYNKPTAFPYPIHASNASQQTSTQQFPTIPIQNYQSLFQLHNLPVPDQSNPKIVIPPQKSTFTISSNNSVADSEDSSTFSVHSPHS